MQTQLNQNNESDLTTNGGSQLALLMEIPIGTQVNERHFTLPAGVSLEQWKSALRFVARCRESSGFWMAEVIEYGRKNYGDEPVKEECRAQDVQQGLFKESQLLTKLPHWDFELGPDHHHVLARAKLDQTGFDMWVDLAKKNNLSSAELQESIKKGTVTRITPNEGDGAAGVVTWGGIRMQFDLIRRRIADVWRTWTIAECDTVLGQLNGMVKFATELQCHRRELLKAAPKTTEVTAPHKPF